MSKIKQFIVIAFLLSGFQATSQNAPFYLWGTGLDGSVYQKTAIYSDTNYGLLFEAPKDGVGNKLNIEFNWRGSGPTPFYIQGSSGNVGIGTKDPNSSLEVLSSTATGSITVNSTATNQYSSFGWKAGGVRKWSIYQHPGIGYALLFMNDLGQDVLTIKQDGSLGIGTTTPDSKLTVKGTIHSQEVKVDLLGSVAPDYVFEKDYRLASLQELKSYIEENKHLPEIPSAKEMDDEGINLKEMNLLLLKRLRS